MILKTKKLDKGDITNMKRRLKTRGIKHSFYQAKFLYLSGCHVNGSFIIRLRKDTEYNIEEVQ